MAGESSYNREGGQLYATSERTSTVTEELFKRANDRNVVFTSLTGGIDYIAVPLAQIPGDKHPDWDTNRVEIELPLIRPVPETEEDADQINTEHRRHFVVSSQNPKLLKNTPGYFYTLFSTEELRNIVFDDTKMGSDNDHLKLILNVYGVGREAYENCDDVMSFIAQENIVSSLEMKLEYLVKFAGEDLVGMLIFVEISPSKIYLVRPEVMCLEAVDAYLDLSCLICFTFPKTRRLEIEDFFNDDEEEESEVENTSQAGVDD